MNLRHRKNIDGLWLAFISWFDLAKEQVTGIDGVVQQSVLHAAVPLIQERLDTLTQAVGMLGFLMCLGAARGLFGLTTRRGPFMAYTAKYQG